MAAILPAKGTAAATAATDITADVRCIHTTATAAARDRVAGHRDVIQGQDTEIDYNTAHRCGTVGTRLRTVASRQALGDDQGVQGRGDTGVNLQHLRLVLPADGHISNAIEVQVAFDGQVLADDQL